jgi:anthranilate phosphoribosyltransferase
MINNLSAWDIRTLTLFPNLNQILRNLELGLAALGGEKGAAYDRIVLNAAMADHLLGCSGAEDIDAALDRAREAIGSGEALRRLMSYIKISHKVS